MWSGDLCVFDVCNWEGGEGAGMDCRGFVVGVSWVLECVGWKRGEEHDSVGVGKGGLSGV